MSAIWAMEVTSAAVSLVATISLPPETVTVFVTLAGAVADTLTVSVMAGKLLPAARTSLRVAVSVLRFTVQPVPLMAVAVNPAGKTSTRLTVPAVGPVPELLTVMVYVSPVSFCLNAGLWVTATVKSGSGYEARSGTSRLAIGAPRPVTLS